MTRDTDQCALNKNEMEKTVVLSSIAQLICKLSFIFDHSIICTTVKYIDQSEDIHLCVLGLDTNMENACKKSLKILKG